MIEKIARLRLEGKLVRIDGEYERRHPEVVKPFIAKVEAAVTRLRDQKLGIRRKKGKKGKRKR